MLDIKYELRLAVSVNVPSPKLTLHAIAISLMPDCAAVCTWIRLVVFTAAVPEPLTLVATITMLATLRTLA